MADDLPGLSSGAVEVGRVAVAETGVFEVPLSGNQIAKLAPSAAAITVAATLAGTTPSITYGAYLAPVN